MVVIKHLVLERFLNLGVSLNISYCSCEAAIQPVYPWKNGCKNENNEAWVRLGSSKAL